uniref:Uncharacterized protein n=1 Tax=Lepeophtheirus salmonis TaxID=72036 RepID=A0A0K2U6B6_LEPSM
MNDPSIKGDEIRRMRHKEARSLQHEDEERIRRGFEMKIAHSG